MKAETEGVMSKIKLKEFHFFRWVCPICETENEDADTKGETFCDTCWTIFSEDDFDENIVDGMEG